MSGIAVLAEDGDEVTFGKVEGEATDVDVGGVTVVGVPGGGGGHSGFEFALVEGLSLSN
jgi:hypothetical protein